MNELDLFVAASPSRWHAARRQYLDRECVGDDALRRRVDGLLSSSAAAVGPLDAPPAGSRTGLAAGRAAGPPTASVAPGTAVSGKYRLTGRIGEGGMGEVWRAEQTAPVRRPVAVKFVKAGMDSRQVLARFDAERHALARMDHPNVARVLDGGLHDGRPYFVMELIDGVPVTDYCDAHKLTPAARLGLFTQVCLGVQHAHQKGLIHRDLKPGNVLVAGGGPGGDPPAVKVIDFGVAKAVFGSLSEATLDTAVGSVVGTPQSMSPEQATPGNPDIDTRSDVYSLGVLLYELLAGELPFLWPASGANGVLEVLRAVREDEPVRPSARLSAAEALPRLAADRGTEPAKLARLLRDELDWVVMKALEKDRDRRYGSAAELAADARRFLAGESVLAHPPGVAYRARKFLRKRRGPVAAAAVALGTLLAGLAGTTWGLVRAERAAAAERTAKERVQKGNEILTAVFTDLDIRAVKEGTEPLEAVLAKRLVAAGTQLDGDAVGEPLAVARLQFRLGQSLTNLGFAAEAIPLQEKAHATLSVELGAADVETLRAANGLAVAHGDAGRVEVAVPMFEASLEAAQAHLGPDHPDTLTILANLAIHYRKVGQTGRAVRLLEQALGRKRAVLGPDDPGTLLTMRSLALAYFESGQRERGLALHEEALAGQTRKVGRGHPATIGTLASLGSHTLAAGRNDRAIPLLEEALALSRVTLGLDHLATVKATAELAVAYATTGQNARALPLYEDALARQRLKLGHDHRTTLATALNLTYAYNRAGQSDKSVPLAVATLRAAEAAHGPGDPVTLLARYSLGTTYVKAGRLPDGVAALEEVFAARQARLGADDPVTLATAVTLATVQLAAGKPDAALALLRDAHQRRAATLGPGHADTLEASRLVAVVLLQLRRSAEAVPVLEELVRLQAARVGRDDLATLRALNELGMAYGRERRFGRALPVLEESAQRREAKYGADHLETLLGVGNLGQTCRLAGQPGRALALLEPAAGRAKVALGAGHLTTIDLTNKLAAALGAAGRVAESLTLHEEVAASAAKHLAGTPEVAQYARGAADALRDAGQFGREEPWRRKLLALAKPSAPDPDDDLAALGRNLLRQGKWADAEATLRAGLAAREGSQPAAWATHSLRSVLGGALLGQKKYADAEPLLLSGYRGMAAAAETIPDAGRVRLNEAAGRLVDLYSATGDAAQAAKWRAERATIREVLPRPRELQ